MVISTNINDAGLVARQSLAREFLIAHGGVVGRLFQIVFLNVIVEVHVGMLSAAVVLGVVADEYEARQAESARR